MDDDQFRQLLDRFNYSWTGCRKLWYDLEEYILPRMIETEKKTFQVWSAGCARGEEVYSFKTV
jgi:chemotaxis methyl-accepting protein methylase